MSQRWMGCGNDTFVNEQKACLHPRGLAIGCSVAETFERVAPDRFKFGDMPDMWNAPPQARDRAQPLQEIARCAERCRSEFRDRSRARKRGAQKARDPPT